MKQIGIAFIALAVVALAACGDSKDVCGAQKSAAKACSFVGAPLDTCADNIKSCSDSDRVKWVNHFDCMQQACDSGESEIVVQQDCTGELDGVAYSCTPGGTGL